jgi:hypothetical protein
MTIVDLATSAQLQQQQQAMEVEEDAKAEQQELGAGEQELSYSILMKGVRHLSDSGITRLPDRYVLPAPDRPGAGLATTTSTSRVKLPVVDLARLRDPSQRAAVLQTLDAACRGYGFFQVGNN